MITQIPDIQGHRGCRGLMPENTIPAFTEAIRLGVTTLEMDVVMSKYGDVVISHEPYFNSEFSSDPNGHPISKSDEQKYNIYNMTADEIKKFDVGSRTNPKYPMQSKIKCYKPLLGEVIDTVAAYCKRNNIPLVMFNIEIKYDRDKVGQFFPEDTLMVDSVLSILISKNLIENTTIQSFDTDILNICHAKEPNVQYAILVDNIFGLERNLSNLKFKPNTYSPRYTKVDKNLVENCKAMGLKVIPWTVNDEDDITTMLSYGVDGIISDFPDRVIEIAKGHLKQP